MNGVTKECIACDGAREHRLRPLVLPVDDPRFAGYLIAECASCGLQSSHPLPDREELRSWYAAAVPTNIAKPSGIRRLWHQVEDARLLAQAARLAPSGRFLEIGAGAGRLASAALRTGRWEVIATEYSEQGVERLRSLGIEARIGDIEELGLADGSIDVVWASHVMEHLPDPVAFLREVHRVLRPGGVLVALVPSNRSLRARTGTSTWHLVNPPGHLWSFSPKTFAATLGNCGFAVRHLREVHLVCELTCLAQR